MTVGTCLDLSAGEASPPFVEDEHLARVPGRERVGQRRLGRSTTRAQPAVRPELRRHGGGPHSGGGVRQGQLFGPKRVLNQERALSYPPQRHRQRTSSCDN